MRVRVCLPLCLLALWAGPAWSQTPPGFVPASPPPGPYDTADPGDAPPDAPPDLPPDLSALSGPYNYAGMHPIPYEVGGGFCTIQGMHSHDYRPFDTFLFRQVNGTFYFIGDPQDFGYGQSLYWYRGNHPVPPEYGGGYCYMDWPHRHLYPPGDAYMPYYRNVNGYWVWGGTYDPAYYQYRDMYTHYYTDYYRSHYYGNRYERLRPAPLYRPAVPVPVATPVAPPPRMYGVPAAPYYPPSRVVPPPAPTVRMVPPPAPTVRMVPPPAPTVRMVPPPAPVIRAVPPPAPVIR